MVNKCKWLRELLTVKPGTIPEKYLEIPEYHMVCHKISFFLG
ncbi:MAG: hypothetical protein R6V20_04410 [Desulfobia sp.]